MTAQTPSNLNLSPDPNTQNNINQTISSVGSVSSYCASVLATNIPQSLPGNIYTQLNTALNSVKSHSTYWMNDLGPMVSATFPDMVLEFSQQFSVSSNAITTILNTIINNQHGVATQAQQTQISRQIASLTQLIDQQSTMLESIQGNLINFNTNLEQDRSTLSTSSSDIQHILNQNGADQAALQRQIQQVQADIQSDQTMMRYMWLLGPLPEWYLYNQIQNLQAQLTQLLNGLSADQQQNATLMMVGNSFDDLVSQNLQTQTIYTSIINSWSVLHGKYTAVENALNKANGNNVAPLLQQVDMSTANREWQQLAQFVQNLKAQGEQHRREAGV
ncbi:MAG: HBL/NHE enterotoxin family protein [Sulfuricellaceae bacterium]|nr:HBL/NHE enterotoxin family protein [Sulfuricellaceae bacterium]